MKSPQRLLQEYLVRTTPKGAVIKKYAHAITLAAFSLTVLSVWAIFLRWQGIREDEPDWVWAAETLWKIHLGIVALACILWVIERPKKTDFLPVDPIDD